MQLILKRIILFFFLTTLLSTNSWSEIKFKTVTVSAAGLSYEEALNNAFAEAIAMVNGKNIQTKTIIQVLSGDPLSKEIAQDKKQVGFLADLLSQFNKPERPSMNTQTHHSEEDIFGGAINTNNENIISAHSNN